MKKLYALAYLMSLSAMAQNNEKACEIFSKINTVLQARHYNPKPIDDSLSVYVFETIMEQLDDNRVLFLQEDHDFLAKHKYRIDDYLLNKDCSFFSDFLAVYKKGLERNSTFIKEIEKIPLTYATKDTIFYSRRAFPYHNRPERLKNFLRKKINYDIYEDIAKQSKNKDSLKQHLNELGKPSKTKVIDAYLCRVNSQLNPAEGFDNSMYNRFFSVFCSYFDPHSTYFNYNEKQSFVSSISTENYSLGLYVSQNDSDEVVVEEVVPGGPAYKTKIVKGDQIIKFATNSTEYVVSCSSMETVNTIFSSDNYKQVDLTLRKKDGTVYSISLEKTIMKADDHTVYSYLLDGENKIGYIKIPSFYTAFDSGGNGCSDDVAQEVMKLKESDIKGLIIDLQFNGGGSMEEVIRMAGMFINFGPLSIITDKSLAYNTIRDYNRGMLYSGPMVVLVNGFTASASEFFAGVMQDYNRAVIVGNTTVGKATMQAILPLEEKDPEDFVKVTIDKFYRVTGKSSQYTGIIPDVELPVFFEKMMPRECTMPTAIKNDSLDIRLRYSKIPDTDLKKAVVLSRQRIQASDYLNTVKDINGKIDVLYNTEKPPLQITFDNVYNDVHSMDVLWKEITQMVDEENDIKVASAQQQKEEILASDDYFKSMDEYKIKMIKADRGIYESLNILRDLKEYKIR